MLNLTFCRSLRRLRRNRRQSCPCCRMILCCVRRQTSLTMMSVTELRRSAMGCSAVVGTFLLAFRCGFQTSGCQMSCCLMSVR